LITGAGGIRRAVDDGSGLSFMIRMLRLVVKVRAGGGPERGGRWRPRRSSRRRSVS
jgi:hypothetical protein